MPLSSVITSDKVPLYKAPFHKVLSTPSNSVKPVSTKPVSIKKSSITALLMVFLSSASYVHADSMSDLITQKTAQPELAVPSAKINTRSTIQRTRTNYSTINNTNSFNTQPTSNTYGYNQQSQNRSVPNTSYRYPEVQRQAPLPSCLHFYQAITITSIVSICHCLVTLKIKAVRQHAR